MKQQLRFIAALSAIALSALTAQAQVEVLPFSSWVSSKAETTFTSAKGTTAITATSGKTVYLETATYYGHSLNNRIAFEDGTKLKADKGLVISGKDKTVSIQGLQAGDIVKVTHNAKNEGTDANANVFISSKNVSYTSAGSTVSITSSAEEAACYLQSDVSYTLTSGNSLDFFCNNGKQYRITAITIVRPQITIGTTGYATYSNLTSTDLTLPDGLSAYTVSHGEDASAEVTLTRTTGIIPAGAGVVLKGEANQTYTFTPSTTVTTVDNNLMEAVTEDTKVVGSADIKTDGVKTTYYNYLLAVGDDNQVGFYQSSGKKNSDTNTDLAAGKSYLHIAKDLVTSSKAKSLTIVFDDGDRTTGISSVKGDSHSVRTRQGVYNLSGQRVGANYHGIVIINGRKVIK